MLVCAGTTLTTLELSVKASLTGRCLDGLCDSFRRAGLAVHEVIPAALSAEALGMRIIKSSRCLRTCRHAYFSYQVGVARLDTPSSSLRKGRATDCWSSPARSAVPSGLGLEIRCAALDVMWNSVGLFEVLASNIRRSS